MPLSPPPPASPPASPNETGGSQIPHEASLLSEHQHVAQQSTPPPFFDLTHIPGCAFPLQAKDALWPGGTIKTKLPWVSKPEEPHQNILQNVCVSLNHI